MTLIEMTICLAFVVIVGACYVGWQIAENINALLEGEE
jgi:glycerol-3-phosphate acyltransferase PlsY